VIVPGTPKREIQVKVKAFAYAAADVSERGMAHTSHEVFKLWYFNQTRLMIHTLNYFRRDIRLLSFVTQRCR
jgi:hypothetical protein